MTDEHVTRLRVVRFGAFEADLVSGELRKHGLRVHLQARPFQMLAVLLERPGEMVRREELRKQLWGDEVFVDFDRSLNIAMAKLRLALGDDPDRPRYIETLPRRGYRFIGPIAPDVHSAASDSSQPSPSAITHPSFQPQSNSLADTLDALRETGKEETVKREHAGSSPEQIPYRVPRTSRLLILIGAVSIVLAIAATYFFVRQGHARGLTEADRLLVSDFDNETGDSVFDETLKQALIAQLEQSPFLNVLPEGQVSQALDYMGRERGTRLTGPTAIEVCERTGSKALLEGSISAAGDRYAVGLRAVNCRDGGELAVQQEEANGRDQVLNALGRASTKIRASLGESLNSIQKYDVPLEQVTTSSIEALRAYSVGVRTSHLEGNNAAVPFFQRAIELDGEFAMAYARLAPILESAPGMAAARKAYDLRQRVSERERLQIDAYYYQFATDEIQKAAQVYEVWRKTYPRDQTPHYALGDIDLGFGQYQKSVVEFREALSLEPNSVETYTHLASAYLSLNRPEQCQDVLSHTQAGGLTDSWLFALRYVLGFLRNDEREMQTQAEAAAGQTNADYLLLRFQADTEAYHGRVGKARELTQEAVNAAERDGNPEAGAVYEAELALRDAEYGDAERARKEAAAALLIAPGPFVRTLSALALARTGESARALEMAQQLNRERPLSTLSNGYWLPTIRAAAAEAAPGAEGTGVGSSPGSDAGTVSPSKAVEILDATRPYDFGWTGNLWAIYLRGQAYLQLRDGENAAHEFQEMVDHSGILMNFPTGALAHLGLARARAIAGEKQAARQAYEDFFALWKDADPDTPILKQAKAEYTRLQ